MGGLRFGIGTLLAAGSLAAGASTACAADMTPEQAQAAVNAAFAEQKRGNLEGVIPLLDPVIAAFESMQARSATFCSENQKQTLALLLTAASDHNEGKSSAPGGKTVVVNEAFCIALFLKGYVMVDMGRNAEAETFLRRAHEGEPLNAHFLNEYAEWYKMAGQWQRAHDLFAEALDKASYADDESQPKYRARALRGMGYTEIELGKLDDAEKHMPESQKYDPDSNAAKHELEYIARLRKHRST